MKDNKLCKFDTLRDFFDIFFQCDVVDQHLLCELYMHGFIMSLNTKFSPSPYVEDIQLRVFIYFVNNMVNWKLA